MLSLTLNIIELIYKFEFEIYRIVSTKYELGKCEKNAGDTSNIATDIPDSKNGSELPIFMKRNCYPLCVKTVAIILS